MKKQVLTFVCLLFVLTACAAQPLQLNKLDTLPEPALNLVTDEPVQLITHDDETYVIVRSTADIEAAFDIVEGTLQLHFHTMRDDGKTRVNVYEIIKGDAQYDRIELYMAQQRVL